MYLHSEVVSNELFQGDLTKHPHGNSSSDKETQKLVVPKEEIPDFEMPSHAFLSRSFEVWPPSLVQSSVLCAW